MFQITILKWNMDNILIRTFFWFSHVKYITSSIAGVTYMDHFDFEDRYRNVNECNPLYYHPLHMPEECMEMYEQLIRSNIASFFGPMQVFKERNLDEINGELYSLSHSHNIQKTDLNLYISSMRQRLSPLERMIEMIRYDAMRIPTAPEIRMAPQFGPVAMYRQPISSKSEKMIKKISGAYGKKLIQQR
ncbi:unnamed protein product [Parnassius apollo]|uniref:(apollo) hypothetical protein n=1 Tax=Parnassius apollo TaxID=110799 RepID=A0A8S3VZR7_PARAO|nr:unnamed protein product [Parnassius apollo]